MGKAQRREKSFALSKGTELCRALLMTLMSSMKLRMYERPFLKSDPITQYQYTSQKSLLHTDIYRDYACIISPLYSCFHIIESTNYELKIFK